MIACQQFQQAQDFSGSLHPISHQLVFCIGEWEQWLDKGFELEGIYVSWLNVIFQLCATYVFFSEFHIHLCDHELAWFIIPYPAFSTGVLPLGCLRFGGWRCRPSRWWISKIKNKKTGSRPWLHIHHQLSLNQTTIFSKVSGTMTWTLFKPVSSYKTSYWGPVF